MSKALLSTAYLPPVQYFTKLLLFDDVLIEKHEHYSKQSWRNRCRILAANGTLDLSVPIQKGRSKTPIKDLRIGYETNWQHEHRRSIISAYNNSPFFEYYADTLLPFFEKKHDFLFDFNTELLHTILEEIGLDTKISSTSHFIKENSDLNDFRATMHPKTQHALPDPRFTPAKYTQVFADKFDFMPNLSIIDLLFNIGPDTLPYLEKCITP